MLVDNRHLSITILFVVLLFGCNGNDTASTGAKAASYRSVDCPRFLQQQSNASCGLMDVAENRDNINSERLNVLVVRVAASNPDPTLPPVVYLAGGPGGPAIATIGAFLDDGPVSWLREKQELILLDQRGAGYSLPSMHCPETTGIPGSTTGIAECRARLISEGRDIGAYTTPAIAADVEDLRKLLKINQWDLYGLSYGTTLALSIMGNYPDGIRSVVLDSPYPPQLDTVDDEVYATLWLTEQIAIGCDVDPVCNTAFPDLRADIATAIAQFDANPIPASDLALPPQFGDGLLDGTGLLELLKSAFAEPFAAALIHTIATQPRDTWMPFIASLASDVSGNPESIGDLTVPIQTDIGGTGAVGMNHSVVCSELLADTNPPALDLTALDWPDDIVSRLRTQAASYTEVCSIWDIEGVDSLVSMPVVSNIPTLILSGTTDSSTPLPFATETLRSLENASLSLIPDAGHGVFESRCAATVTGLFFANPNTTPLADCVSDTHLARYDTELLPSDQTGGEFIDLYGDLLSIPAEVFNLPDTIAILNQIADQASARFTSESIIHTTITLENGARYIDADYSIDFTRQIINDIVSSLEQP